MKLLSWNVNFRRPENCKNLIEKIASQEPDIVTLQEVKVNFAKDWAKHLSEIGLGHHYLSGEDVWSGKDVPASSYQCLIASCWQVTPDDIGWRRSAPYPELLGRAVVAAPDERDIDVITAHIPNGCGNGWKKIDTFQVLSGELRRAMDSPRILTGDFNEPKRFGELGQIVTFEGGAHEDGGTNTGRWCDQFGVERPLNEWSTEVLSVLDGESQHGLRDAYRVCNGHQTPDLFTWRTRCFDHAFVSRHFEVLDCGYYHKWRHQLELSDHSPMWANLRLCTSLNR